MNKSYLGEAIRIPVRMEDLAGASLTGITTSHLRVNFAFETDTTFDQLTPTTEFTLEELSRGQYFLIINATLNVKAENYQVDVDSETCCPTIVTKRYSGTVQLKKFENNAVHVRFGSGYSGSIYPVGTVDKPVATIADAWTIAVANKLSKAFIYTGNTTLAIAADKFNQSTLEGISSIYANSGLNLAGVRYGITYYRLGLQRSDAITNNERYPNIIECEIRGNFGLDQGYITDSIINTSAIIALSGATSIIKTLFKTCDLDLQYTSGATWELDRCSGILTIKNLTHASGILNIYNFDGKIIIDSSCTNGTINIYGIPKQYTDSHGGTCAVNLYENILTTQQIRDAMKLAPTAGAPAADSVDIHLDDIKVTTDKFVFTGSDVHSNVRAKDSTLGLTTVEKSDVNAEADQALADYDGPTKAEMDTAHALLATPAQVNTQCLAAITSYDPPTRTEATADKDEILVDTLFLKKVQVNRRNILLEAGQYYLYIYDNDDTTPIAKCLLEKFGGGVIGALGGTTEPTIRNKTSV